MNGVGDVWTARSKYFDKPSANLKVVVANRYDWMNRFIEPNWKGLEVGCGAGLSRSFIRNEHFLLTDYGDYEWLDVKHVDALHTPFEDSSFDFAICSNMIHHLAHPLRFFAEMSRILRPGGRLIVQDVHCSVPLRLALRVMRHEGYDFNVDVFDSNEVCTDPVDNWIGNNAIVDLLLEDKQRLLREIPQFKLTYENNSEFLTFLNSGGVGAKTFYVPLPMLVATWVDKLDRVLIRKFPKAFAMQVQLVFEKRHDG